MSILYCGPRLKEGSIQPSRCRGAVLSSMKHEKHFFPKEVMSDSEVQKTDQRSEGKQESGRVAPSRGFVIRQPITAKPKPPPLAGFAGAWRRGTSSDPTAVRRMTFAGQTAEMTANPRRRRIPHQSRSAVVRSHSLLCLSVPHSLFPPSTPSLALAVSHADAAPKF